MAKTKKYDYFRAYKKLSEYAVQESEMLIETIRTFENASALSHTLEAVHEIENQGDDITRDIYTATASDFMPPFDREDVIELAQALDEVLDRIDSVMQHLYMYDVRTMPADAMKFAELIRDSAKALDKAMDEFHSFKKNKKFRHRIDEINEYEEKGDALYIQVNRNLHTGVDMLPKGEGQDELGPGAGTDPDPFHVIVWTRIYMRMEDCCDACEHAADIMNTILLKN